MKTKMHENKKMKTQMTTKIHENILQVIYNAQVQNKYAPVRHKSASLEKRKTAMVNARRLSFTNDKMFTKTC